ncbi:unnamed protein product, partial [Medioppia subpectinata]
MKDSIRRVIRCDEIEIFSLIERQEEKPLILDVRYYAKKNSLILSSVFLNSVVLQNRAILESELELNITQIGINECLGEEGHECESTSCTTEHVLDESSDVLINGNYTSLVGINLRTKANCVCDYEPTRATRDSSCAHHKCLNGGTCVQSDHSNYVRCDCPHDMDGPECQLRSRSFNGEGWLWLKGFSQCSESHISLQFMTQMSNGLIFYFGPLSPPPESSPFNTIITDFMSLELRNGRARLLYDFGSGAEELMVQSPHPLNNGEWHTIDI